MQPDPPTPDGNRPLTDAERHLARWMLERGTPAAAAFLPQLDAAEVTPWRCDCGCASINFDVRGLSPPTGSGIRVLAGFEFGTVDDLSGIMIYERGGVLGGIEVYSLGDAVPRSLPLANQLRPSDGPATS